MTPTSLRRPSVLARSAAIAATAVLALAACGGTDAAEEETADPAATEQEETADEEAAEDSSEDAAGEEDVAEEETTDDAETEEDADDDAASAEGTEVAIDQEFTDEETGDVITIVSAVRDNPTEHYEATDNPDGEMVYLEVTVVPGDRFGGVISVRDFHLEDDGSEVNYASGAVEEMEEAGYTYYDQAPRRDGEHTGYIPIYVTTTSETLQGAYVRPEAEILGEDESVPEFRGEFEIPAS